MWITLTSGSGHEQTIQVPGDRCVIGREPACDVVLEDTKVSRRHASIRALPDGRLLLEDLGSMNGTYVNGGRIDGPVVLRERDRVLVGDSALMASLAGPGAPPPLPARPPGPATIERQVLRRTANRATVIAVVSLVVALVVGTVAVIATIGEDEVSRATPSAVPSAPPTVPEVIEQVRPSVVVVVSERNGLAFAGGTGWVLDAEAGLIVTNAHVVNGGTSFSIGVGGEMREGEIVGVAPCEDLAVLRVQDVAGLRTMLLGSQEDLEQGETVIALGYPASAAQADELTATVGVVSVSETVFRLAAIDVPHYPNVVQTDAAINPGNSGGPLIDQDMALVGVNSAGITLLGGRTIQGQGYAIGVDRVKEIVPALAEGNSTSWTGLGIGYPTGRRLAGLGLPQIEGVLLSSAVLGTPAAEAGLGGSPLLVTAIDGARVGSGLPGYCRAIGEAASGDTVTLTAYEPGSTQPRSIPLELG